MIHNTEGDLHIFHYGQLIQNNSSWEASTLLARGLVLRRDAATGATEVVAMPWPKFFNLGEDGLTLKELAARTEGGGHVEVTSKMDGSLGLVFHVDGGWRVCTKGSFTSEQGRWATSWLSEHVDVSALAAGTTYLVEIIYSDNRIVIPCKTRLLEFACMRRTPLTCENVSQTHSTGSSCSPRTTSVAWS